MKFSLNKVRTPKKDMSFKKQIMITACISIFGFALGILQKWMDNLPSNDYPILIQQLDIRNFFGRLSIWILLSTIISVYSKTPLRASINTFCFLVSMLSGYYIYCNYVLGFLPETYMMIWIGFAVAAFFMAYACWYAKGDGIIAIIISSIIIGVLSAQAFSIIQSFHIYHFTEVVTLLIGMIILYRKPREFVIEVCLSIVIALLYQMFLPYFG